VRGGAFWIGIRGGSSWIPLRNRAVLPEAGKETESSGGGGGKAEMRGTNILLSAERERQKNIVLSGSVDHSRERGICRRKANRR